MRVIRLDSLEQFAAIKLSEDQGAIGGPVIVPSCAQIVLVWGQDDGITAHNVLYGRYSGPFAGTQTQANGILSALGTGAAWTAMAAHMPPTSFLAGVTIRDVAVKDQPLIESNAAGHPGTSSGTPMPNETAICVTLRTAKAGRSGRGRMYIPNWATTALGAANVINAAAVTAVNNWAATVGGALNTQGYVFVLGLQARAEYTSNKTGTLHPARAATSEVITSATCRDNHWDSQRRRGLK